MVLLGQVRVQPANPPGMLLICKLEGLPALAHQYGTLRPIWVRFRLDVHILDYLKKRNLQETAASFKHECKVSDKPCGKPFFHPSSAQSSFVGQPISPMLPVDHDVQP